MSYVVVVGGGTALALGTAKIILDAKSKKKAARAQSAAADAAIAEQESKLKNLDALLTPYVDAGNQALNEYLGALGISVPGVDTGGDTIGFRPGDLLQGPKGTLAVPEHLRGTLNANARPGQEIVDPQTGRRYRVATAQNGQATSLRQVSGEGLHDPGRREYVPLHIQQFNDYKAGRPIRGKVAQTREEQIQLEAEHRAAYDARQKELDAEGDFERRRDTVSEVGEGDAQFGTSEEAARSSQEKFLERIKQSPLYEQQLEAGSKQILAAAGATGGLRGGNTQRALGELGPDVLNRLYTQELGRLEGLMNAGQNAAGAAGGAGVNTGVGISNTLQNQGAIDAGGALAQGSIAGGILGEVGQFTGTLAGSGVFDPDKRRGKPRPGSPNVAGPTPKAF